MRKEKIEAFVREVDMDWQGIVIILLVVWAAYHSIFETQQEKRIKDLDRRISRGGE